MEKNYTIEQIRMLPTTTAANIGSDKPSMLPDPAWIAIPGWLTDTLTNNSNNGEVRAWTRDLTDRFGPEGDKVVADTVNKLRVLLACHEGMIPLWQTPNTEKELLVHNGSCTLYCKHCVKLCIV